MKSNIIVEGVECAGKTTLINTIRREIAGWDLKFLGHKPNTNQYTRFEHEYTVNSNTIFNRAHYSEEIYSKLWNREKPFSSIESRSLDEHTNKNSLVILVIPPSKEIMLKRFKERGYKQNANIDELEKINQLFLQRMSKVDKLVYCSSSFTELNNTVEKIKKFFKEK